MRNQLEAAQASILISASFKENVAPLRTAANLVTRQGQGRLHLPIHLCGYNKGVSSAVCAQNPKAKELTGPHDLKQSAFVARLFQQKVPHPLARCGKDATDASSFVKAIELCLSLSMFAQVAAERQKAWNSRLFPRRLSVAVAALAE